MDNARGGEWSRAQERPDEVALQPSEEEEQDDAGQGTCRGGARASGARAPAVDQARAVLGVAAASTRERGGEGNVRPPIVAPPAEVAGAPTIFLVAEDSTQWAPDLSGPLTPDASNTLSVPVDGITFPPSPGSSEFGFGNFVAGDYYADYETVRIIRSSESDTVLPAALNLVIPTLGVSGVAVLVILFATAGLALLVRSR